METALWFCGVSQHGQLGLGPGAATVVDAPAEIKALANLEVVKLAAGGRHCAAAVTDASVRAAAWRRQAKAELRLPPSSGQPSPSMPIVDRYKLGVSGIGSRRASPAECVRALLQAQ